MRFETFDGVSLLLVIGMLGFIHTLLQNRRYRRALRHVASNCRRCSPGTPGQVFNGATRYVPCPNCRVARVALGER